MRPCRFLIFVFILLLPSVIFAASEDHAMASAVGSAMDYANGTSYMRIVVLMTLLALVPILLISATAFTRILIVLSSVRMGLGMPETPSSSVIITLALCLTMFAMAPVGRSINEVALQPYLENKISSVDFIEKASVPLKKFMLAHTREADILLVDDLARGNDIEGTAETEHETLAKEPPLWQLVPAFMLSELRTAFQMAFMVLLPFLLVDLLVSVGLMSLGMMMVPPTTIALPLKILMFVLVDGWALIARSLVMGYS
ncbi:flagellar type III secretion system pore protein FliP [Chitiniphilus shinanonensis]|nr:flagellar biosynthesis protein flip [Chitiniphilus shinanonensis]